MTTDYLESIQPAEFDTSVSPTVGGRSWRKALRRGRPTILGISSIVLFLFAWQLAFDLRLVNRLFVIHPYGVLVGLENLVSSGELWHNLAVSGEEFGLGLSISIVIGGVVGILAGWYKPVEEFLRPSVIGLNSMPHIAIVPLLILIFGIGITPKVVVVVISCAVTIILNTAAGVENADRHLLMMSRSFCASDRQAIRTIVLPSVVPFFMTGVRISVGRAVVAVVVAEIFASRAGLGNLLISSSNSFNMPLMYATLFVLTLLGIILTQGATYLERRMQRWRE